MNDAMQLNKEYDWQSELSISVGGEPGTGLDLKFEDPMPTAWRRFWYWALLGWKWRSIK